MPNCIVKEKSAKYIESKSKFYSYSFFCDSVDRQNEILKSLRQKHIGCTHVCFASSIDEGEIKLYSSDDREPSGTAGAQLASVLKKNDLVNVLLVVVRFFGGVKLGVQNLSHAYKLSGEMCIENNTHPVEKYFKYKASSSYENFDAIKRVVIKSGLKIFDEQFDENINFSMFLTEKTEILLKNLCYFEKTDEFSYL